MKCPVCRAPYREKTICPRCQTDLQPLLEIRNKAILNYNYALGHAQQAEWSQAIELVDQAITLFQSQAEFHLLRGKILIHFQQYEKACQAWQLALKCSPSLSAAQTCLITFQYLLEKMAGKEQ